MERPDGVRKESEMDVEVNGVSPPPPPPPPLSSQSFLIGWAVGPPVARHSLARGCD